MKPAIYADDVENHWLPLKAPYAPPSGMESLVENVARILPRRCSDCAGQGTGGAARWRGKGDLTEQCPNCVGVGWLYPDPPDWSDGTAAQWEQHWRITWRALGVTG